MKKVSKLSLVTAVAVVGFSTANAQPLEEAIKNVEVSGSVVYRYDNSDNKPGDTNFGEDRRERNRYKIALNLSSKVNDDVKFNSRFLVANGSGDFAGIDDASRNNARGGGDSNADVWLSHANFAYIGITNTTIIAGKQGLNTPYTMAIDSDGGEHTGTGLLALANLKPVTIGVGYFNQTNLDTSSDLNGSSSTGAAGGAFSRTSNLGDITRAPIGLSDGQDIGSRDLYVGTIQADLSPVKLEAWYLDLADTLNTYTLVASANFKLSDSSKFGIEARYVDLELDHGKDVGLWSDDNSMWKLLLTGQVGIVNAKASYTQTDEDGGLTAFDKDTKNTTLGWNMTINGIPDATMWDLRIGVDILDNLELAGYYGMIEADGDKDKFGITDYEASEYFAQLTYKMSKNLTTYLRYGNWSEEWNNGAADDEKRDQDIGRLQIEYTF